MRPAVQDVPEQPRKPGRGTGPCWGKDLDHPEEHWRLVIRGTDVAPMRNYRGLGISSLS